VRHGPPSPCAKRARRANYPRSAIIRRMSPANSTKPACAAKP
jgi:hypothetical protein